VRSLSEKLNFTHPYHAPGALVGLDQRHPKKSPARRLGGAGVAFWEESAPDEEGRVLRWYRNTEWGAPLATAGNLTMIDFIFLLGELLG